MRNQKLVSGLAFSVVSLLVLCTLASAPQAAGASFAPAWEVESPMSANTTQAVVVQDVDGIVYSVGGVIGLVGGSYGAVVSDSYKFNPSTGEWSEIAPMPIGVRGAAGAMGHDGKVYVFGGANDTLGTVADTQIYDPTTDTWSAGTDAPAPLWESKAVAGYYDDEVFVVGGQGLGSSMYMYNTEDDTWTARAPTPAPVLGGVFVRDSDYGDFYYMGGGSGGYTGTDIVYRYTYWGDAWTTMGAMPDPLVAHAAVCGHDDLIYVAGGSPTAYNIDSAYNTTYCYNPDLDEWTQLGDLPVASKYLGMASSPEGEIFVFGGNDEYAVFDQVASLEIFRSSVSLSKTVLSAGETFTVSVNIDTAFVVPDSGIEYYAVIVDDGGMPQNPVYGWAEGEFSSIAFDMTVPMGAEPGDFSVMLAWALDTDVGGIESVWMYVPFVVVESYTVEEQISMLEENITALQDALAAQADAHADEIAALQALVDELQTALGALAADVDAGDEALMDEIAALEDQISSLEDMLAGLQNSIDDMEDSLNNTQDSVDDVGSSIDSKMDGTLGYAIIVLLVVVVVLMLVMMVMGRRPKLPAPPVE